MKRYIKADYDSNLVFSSNPMDRYNLVQAVPPDPEVLEILAYDSFPPIRSWIASSPSTPPHILDDYARSRDDLVRRQALSNPGTPSETLIDIAREYVVKRQDFTTANYLMCNPECPPEVLLMILQVFPYDSWIRNAMTRGYSSRDFAMQIADMIGGDAKNIAKQIYPDLPY